MNNKTPTSVMEALHLVIDIVDGLKEPAEQRKLLAMAAANYGCTLTQAEKSAVGGFARYRDLRQKPRQR